MEGAKTILPECPHCGCIVPPQVLQFDESYESHSFYQWEKVMNWMQEAEGLVFVGLSFSVTLTKEALEIAARKGIPVYNFNTVFDSRLARSQALNSFQIIGDCEELLPRVAEAVKQRKAPMHT
jgi:NAD-dependent SIR2 family protein deacetylase